MGHKQGKGIQRNKDGTIQAEGIWTGNKTLAYSKQIASFLENEEVNVELDQDILVHENSDEEDIR